MDIDLYKKVFYCLNSEYQSLWIINISDSTIKPVSFDEEKSVFGTVKKVEELSDYDRVRDWYAGKCVVENDRKRFLKNSVMDTIIAAVIENGEYSIEYNRIIDGVINYNQIKYFGIRDDKGELCGILLGFRNIDLRRKTEIDDLTSVYTRQAFLQKAEEILKKYPDTDFDLVISDIVDFKKINELYGSKTGDRILRWNGSKIATMMNEKLIVGRYGGDQFALMVPHENINRQKDGSTSENGVMDVNAFVGFVKLYLERLSAELREMNLPEVSLKFGVYENVPKNKSIISSCDKALFAIESIKKRYDKYYAIYNQEIKNKLDVQRKIENSMHRALAEKQFIVYYQPKHNAVTGELVGAEALARWIHPELGFMSPAQFIPVFEQNGFIHELDFYVWERTCENLKKWYESTGKIIPVSVNASKLTFEMPDFTKRLLECVKKYDLTPKDLHIEVTETMMSDNLEELVRKMQEIKDYGFQIELDDFGSGYTSMNILSTVPLDVVKLDMSFMKQFGNEKREKVLAACIKLAKELGYKTVSEGVEIKEQKDKLSKLGVDYIQGYYFSKPLPEEEFEKYIYR